MLKDLREELGRISGQMARQEKIESMLKSLHEDELALSERNRQLFEQLKKEQGDVERLQKTSLTSVLYSLLGNKDERLDKEQQEALAAKLKYDAVVLGLENCRLHIEELERERASLAGCDQRYDHVFNEVRELLKQDSRYAGEICALERKFGENVAQLKEVDEAISAGQAAIDQIGVIANSLGSAESWGTWDLLGGGLISTAVKHSHLDDAQQGAEYLQTLLSRFRTELADVKITAQFSQTNTDGFLRFADWFFDGLIVDWTVLSRIHNSQQSLESVKEQISGALSKLEAIKRSHVA